MRSWLFIAALFGYATALEAAQPASEQREAQQEKGAAMQQLEDAVRKEIEDVHDFFVGWFSGTIAEEELNTYFAPRMHEDMHIISPRGDIMDRASLLDVFRKIYGSNPEVRIAIRNVRVKHKSDTHVLVTYEEWQRNGLSAESGTGRLSSALLLTKTKPFQWLHVQETWLPEEITKLGPYDF